MLVELLLAAQLNYNLIAEYNLEGFMPELRNRDTAYPSGLEYKDESHVKYGPPSIDDPILMIVDAIYDKDMNYIPPGYYQLSLDPARDKMYLMQTGKVLAIIPVFKVEIDKVKDAEKRKDVMPNSFWKQKKYLWKKKRAEKKRKKLIKKKMIEPEKTVYSDATIELVPGEKYFLIKYEKEAVKAWGALKYR